MCSLPEPQHPNHGAPLMGSVDHEVGTKRNESSIGALAHDRPEVRRTGEFLGCSDEGEANSLSRSRIVLRDVLHDSSQVLFAAR